MEYQKTSSEAQTRIIISKLLEQWAEPWGPWAACSPLRVMALSATCPVLRPVLHPSSTLALPSATGCLWKTVMQSRGFCLCLWQPAGLFCWRSSELRGATLVSRKAPPSSCARSVSRGEVCGGAATAHPRCLIAPPPPPRAATVAVARDNAPHRQPGGVGSLCLPPPAS